MTTWLAREIAEIPDAVERLLRDGSAAISDAAEEVAAEEPRWVTFVARGTSDHVATYGRYLVETTLGLPAGLSAASVTTVYRAPIRWRGGLLVAISQSGRSPDLIQVLEAARAAGAATVVVTNDPGSPLARAGQYVLPCLAGPEHAVAASKSYATSLVVVASLVDGLRRAAGRSDAAAVTDDGHLSSGLARLPAVLQATLDVAGPWIRERGIVEAFAATERAIVTSRGYDLATALEVAIKIQETARIFALGISTADLEHGPVILAGPDIPVLAIRPDGEMGRRVDRALERVHATGARPWIVGGQETPAPGDAAAAEQSLQLPIDLPARLAPIAHVLPGQLLAEAVARARGYDPDRPMGLTKVTLTS
jgi:glucosamine--fructose-6-phosphate aminotransferase (isomerizing)